MRHSSLQRERASAYICQGWTEDACRVSSKSSPKPTLTTTCSSCSMVLRAIAQKRSSALRERRLPAPSGLLSRARSGGEMVSRIQKRVVQQGLRDRRVSATSARPSASTLLGGACSITTTHRFLLVGGGRQCVVTSITWFGIKPIKTEKSSVG
jgi:hypothetical protein